MTLCIAAECMHDDKSTIVLCRDWQATKGTLITSDDADKLRDIDEGEKVSRVLLAGIPTRADQLLFACEPHVRQYMRETNQDNTDLHINTLLDGLRSSARTVKRNLVNHWVSMTLNMDFDDFRRTGKDQLLESHYHDIWDTIKRHDLGAELLFALFDACGEAVLIRLDGVGEPHWETDYATIGTGSAIAQAFLCQVDYDGTTMPLQDCLYETLRAKFAAEKSRDVGRGTSVNIIVEGKKTYWISEKAWKFFDDVLNPYKTPKLEMDFSLLEPDLDTDPPSSEALQEEVSSSSESKETSSESGIPGPEQPS